MLTPLKTRSYLPKIAASRLSIDTDPIDFFDTDPIDFFVDDYRVV